MSDQEKTVEPETDKLDLNKNQDLDEKEVDPNQNKEKH